MRGEITINYRIYSIKLWIKNRENVYIAITKYLLGKVKKQC